MQETLNRQDIRIRDKFAGGKTFYEVKALVRGRPGDRQLRRIIAKLKRLDELEDLTPELRGQGAIHRYIPRGDSFGAIRPQSRSRKNAPFDHEHALVVIYEGAMEAITAIRAGSHNRRLARSKDICNRHIKPVVSDIYRLNGQLREKRIVDTWHKVPVPGEFFTEAGYDSYWTRRARSRERKGTLRVRHPDSRSEEDYFFPTLEDWERYFDSVSSELQALHASHLIERYKGSP